MSKSTDKTGKTAVTKDVNMDLSIGTRVDVKGGTHDGKTGTIKKVNDQKPRVLLDDGTEVNIDKKHLVLSQTAASSSSDPETRIFELEAQVDLQAQEMAAQAVLIDCTFFWSRWLRFFPGFVCCLHRPRADYASIGERQPLVGGAPAAAGSDGSLGSPALRAAPGCCSSV